MMTINGIELDHCNPGEKPREVIRYFIQKRPLKRRYPGRSLVLWADAPVDLNFRGGARQIENAKAYLESMKRGYGEEHSWRVVRRTAAITTDIVAE